MSQVTSVQGSHIRCEGTCEVDGWERMQEWFGGVERSLLLGAGGSAVDVGEVLPDAENKVDDKDWKDQVPRPEEYPHREDEAGHRGEVGSNVPEEGGRLLNDDYLPAHVFTFDDDRGLAVEVVHTGWH